MACLRTWFFDFEAIETSSETDQFRGKTPWLFIADGGLVSATIRTVGLSGNTRLWLGWQFAETRPTAITGAAAIGSAITTSDTTVVAGTLSAGSYMWARLGYIVDLTTGTAREAARERLAHEEALAMSLGTAEFPSAAARWQRAVTSVKPTVPNEGDSRRIVLEDTRRAATAGHPHVQTAVLASAHSSAWSNGPPPIPPHLKDPHGSPPPGARDPHALPEDEPRGPCGVLRYDSCGGSEPWGQPRAVESVEPSSVGMDIEPGWSACETKLLETVWGFLRQNDDLVRWAMCMAGASEESIECLLDTLSGDRGTIDFVFSDDCLDSNNNPAKMTADGYNWPKQGGEIEICGDPNMPQGDNWTNALTLFCSYTSNQVSAECAVLALAPSLLHELTHICGESHPNVLLFDFNQGQLVVDRIPCSVPYQTGNFFAWAIAQRYPKGAKSDCCDDVFGSLVPGDDTPIGRVDLDCYSDAYEPQVLDIDFKPGGWCCDCGDDGPREWYGGIGLVRYDWSYDDSSPTIILDGVVVSW